MPRYLVPAIAVVVVAIVGAVAAILLMRGAGTPGGLPLYAGATKLGDTSWQDAVWGTGKTYPATAYDLGTADGGVVYNWYKTEMQKQGWALDGEDGYTAGGASGQAYTKGVEKAVIVVLEGSAAVERGFGNKKVLALCYIRE
jgi:hypothetical protein